MTISIADLIGLASLILSVVALVVTIIGFFASLKFYKDGIALQDSATKALAKIEEKTNTLGMQMTGMFDKTLDAAINNKGSQITQDFEDTTEQIEKASRVVIEKITNDLNNVGAGEKDKLKKFIEEQFKTISEQVNVAQENATDLVTSSDNEFVAVSQFQARILESMRSARKAMTIEKISESVGFSAEIVEKSLNRLLHKRLVKTDGSLYSINEQKEKSDLSIIDKAFQNAAKGQSQVYLASLGVHIQKLNPTFDSRAYGFDSLSDYLKSQKGYKLVDNYVNGLNHPLVEKEK